MRIVDEETHQEHPHCPHCGACQPPLPFRVLYRTCNVCAAKPEHLETAEALEWEVWDRHARTSRRLGDGEKRHVLVAAERLQEMGLSPVSLLGRAVRAQPRVIEALKKRRTRDRRDADTIAFDVVTELLRDVKSVGDAVFAPGVLDVLHKLRLSNSRGYRDSFGPQEFRPETDLQLIAPHRAFAKDLEKRQALKRIAEAIRLSPAPKGVKPEAAHTSDIWSWRAQRWALSLMERVDRRHKGRPVAEVRRALAEERVPRKMVNRFLSMLRAHWAPGDRRPLRLLSAIWLADLERGIEHATRATVSDDGPELDQEETAVSRLRALEARFGGGQKTRKGSAVRD
jgi:hypothetical protein